MATSRRLAHSPTLLLIGLTGFVLQGCAQQPAPVASGARVYAVDQTGAAKLCKVSKVTLSPGKQSEATMTVGNDGGWCGISVANDGNPYDSALLTGRAAHGKVYIHPVGDDTRIDYTPDRFFAGSDSFTASFIPGQPVLHVAVTVTRQGVAATSAPPAPKPATTKKPAASKR